MKLTDIQIRDPFIVPVHSEGRYYLFGTTDPEPWQGKGTGFDAYTSNDLSDWTGPCAAFRPEKSFWADVNFWAPEVHDYRGSWYMFASFKTEGKRRATQVLRADSPAGPYRVHSPSPLTPKDWECLDGTLYVDPVGRPSLVFCHEWVQVRDGEVCAIALNEDLTAAVGEPRVLFRAGQSPWAREIIKRPGTPQERRGYVTDGPFMYRAAEGGLLMLWSSFTDKGYAMGIAKSESGEITGPWKHQDQPLMDTDGGHGMVFRAFTGELYATAHSPNRTPEERTILIKVAERNGTLVRIEG
jgi:arabinan endo-1,5-alpha-L-arabinosidase